MNNTIDECEFTKAQWKVLSLWREDKNLTEIANILKITKSAVSGHLNSIVNKIYKKNLEKYTDWYYLNICKGKYKQCTGCGEIKLIQYYSKKGDRLQSRCKNCQRK